MWNAGKPVEYFPAIFSFLCIYKHSAHLETGDVVVVVLRVLEPDVADADGGSHVCRVRGGRVRNCRPRLPRLLALSAPLTALLLLTRRGCSIGIINLFQKITKLRFIRLLQIPVFGLTPVPKFISIFQLVPQVCGFFGEVCISLSWSFLHSTFVFYTKTGSLCRK